MGTDWTMKTPAEILEDVRGMLVDLPPLPDIMSIVVHPMQWAHLKSWQLYWQLRDEGVHWRKAKRLRRKEWERLKREAHQYAER